jgi:PAS domain S-box-containing protein
MADQAPIVIWVTGADGQLEFINEEYRRYFGLTESQARGDGWQPLVHPDDRDGYVQAFLHAVAQRTRFEAEARVHAVGHWRWIRSIGMPRVTADGGCLGYVGVSQDITADKAALTLHEETARQKDEFIAVLGHELRNPMAAISHAVELLRLVPSAEPVVVRARDVIGRQAAVVSRLLEDLLDVTRLSQGRVVLRRAPVGLARAVGDAVDAVRPTLQARGQSLDLDGIEAPCLLDADQARFAQVLGNVLANAAKFSPEGSAIRISAQPTAAEVTLAVTDRGVGLDAEDTERIFELFTQAHADATRAAGGVGVGLYLARQFARLHGGDLTARSAGRGLGSTFLLRWPRASPAQEAATPAAPARATDAARVLIADDHQDGADMLALLLQRHGCETHVAYDGADAWTLAEQLRPSVVLLDLTMPNGSGYDVCARIRQAPWGSTVFIAALTGRSGAADRAASHDAGFDLHLVKPIDSQALTELLRAARQGP